MSAQSKRRNLRRLLPGIIVSLIALAILFYLVDFERFLEALRYADYRFVGLLFLSTLIWLILRTFVWRTLLQEQPTFAQVFLTLNEGYLLNNFLPFRLGEIGRAYLLGKKANLQFLQVLSTIMIERSLDLVMAAGLLLVTLSFVVNTGFGWQAVIPIGLAVVLGLAFLHILARNQDWALRQFDLLVYRFPILQKILKQPQLLSFFSGLNALTDGRRFLKTIILMVANWVFAIFQYYLLVRAFFPGAQLLWGAFTLSVTSLGIAVPSSPGAIGVMEVAIVGALSAFNLDASVALAAALTAHLSNYLITGLIGAYALVQDGLTLSGMYRDVRQISTFEN